MESSARITKSLRTEDVKHAWWVVDATDQTVGRLATQVAFLIRGKHKPEFTPHVDCGDCVIIVNAEKVKFTGKRADKKDYFRHSGYPGKAKYTSFKEVIEKHPEHVLEHAIKGMLPKNRLGRKMIKQLKVYKGGEHPHSAQQPKDLELKY